MGTGLTGGLYRLLLLLHILCAAVGFGAVAFNGLHRARALHGVIHRADRQYRAVLGQVNGAGSSGRVAEVTELEQLEKRIDRAWGIFGIIFLVILYLMVFTPGQVRAG